MHKALNPKRLSLRKAVEYPIWSTLGKALLCIAQSDLIEIPHSVSRAEDFGAL